MTPLRNTDTAENFDPKTVEGFGREWGHYTQSTLSDTERAEIFRGYFSQIDWDRRPDRVMDFGCGSGRWSRLVAPLVGSLVAVDASRTALEVARNNVPFPNVTFEQATPDTLSSPDGWFDLIFSLGVLHHLPDTEGAIRSLGGKLRAGGVLLLYLYYAFDDKPRWFRGLWRVSDLMRRAICRTPFPLRHALAQAIAAVVYFPLARMAKYVRVPSSWPLRFYANRSFYVMRTDALDRFGTRLEKRFTRLEITRMLTACGFRDIRFAGPESPSWVCTAIKSERPSEGKTR